MGVQNLNLYLICTDHQKCPLNQHHIILAPQGTTQSSQRDDNTTSVWVCECVSSDLSQRAYLPHRQRTPIRSAVINVHRWREILPAHMMSTTTMMMSSPALSWAAWPTSSIVTSSGGREHTHTHTHTHTQSTKCHCEHCDSLSQREDVKLQPLWASAGKDKRIKEGDRRAERPPGVNPPLWSL